MSLFSYAVDDASVDRLRGATYIPTMVQVNSGSEEPQEEDKKMHDFLIAMAFIGMVIAPAVVAAKVNVETADDSK